MSKLEIIAAGVAVWLFLVVVIVAWFHGATK